MIDAENSLNICLRGGVKVPTGGTVRERPRGGRNRCNSDTDSHSLDERRRVRHFPMLFFDAYTLEGKSFRVFYCFKKEYFLCPQNPRPTALPWPPC